MIGLRRPGFVSDRVIELSAKAGIESDDIAGPGRLRELRIEYGGCRRR